MERLAREGCDREAYERTYGVRHRYNRTRGYDRRHSYDPSTYDPAPYGYRYGAPATGPEAVIAPLLNRILGH